MIHTLARGLLASAFTLLAGAVCADDLTLAAADVGVYQKPFGFSRDTSLTVGLHDSPYAGHGIGGFTFHTRGFVVFDLTGVDAPVTSATLHLDATDYLSQGGTLKPGTLIDPLPVSNDSEPFALYDVTTAAGVVSAPHGNASGDPFHIVINVEGEAVFDDLGSGNVLGSFSATAADAPGYIDVALGSAGLASINAHLGGMVIFGIAHTGSQLPSFIFGGPHADQHITLSADAGRHILSVSTVPEPGEAALLGVGAVLLALRLSARRGGQPKNQ